MIKKITSDDGSIRVEVHSSIGCLATDRGKKLQEEILSAVEKYDEEVRKEAVKNMNKIAGELVQECHQPLGTTSVLAANPEYTEQVFQAALEIAFSSDRKGPGRNPEEFRAAVNARIKQGLLGS